MTFLEDLKYALYHDHLDNMEHLFKSQHGFFITNGSDHSTIFKIKSHDNEFNDLDEMIRNPAIQYQLTAEEFNKIRKFGFAANIAIDRLKDSLFCQSDNPNDLFEKLCKNNGFFIFTVNSDNINASNLLLSYLVNDRKESIKNTPSNVHLFK